MEKFPPIFFQKSNPMISLKSENNEKDIYYLSMNPENKLFCIGSKQGYLISSFEYDKPEHLDSNFKNGIIVIEILKDKLIGLVNESFKNKLYIYDYDNKKLIQEIIVTRDIIGLRYSHPYLLIIMEELVEIYNSKFTLISKYDTIQNKNGLCIFEYPLLIIPSLKIGYLSIIDLKNEKNKLLECHESNLVCIYYKNKLLVTASEKGTLIRIFDISSFTEKYCLRRGLEPANIYSLSLDDSLNYLSCSSDSGTIHIWKLDEISYLIFTYPKSLYRISIKGKCMISFIKDDLYVINDLGQFIILKYKENYQLRDTLQF